MLDIPGGDSSSRISSKFDKFLVIYCTIQYMQMKKALHDLSHRGPFQPPHA